MKALKVIALFSPLCILLLYFELLNMDSYYKDLVLVPEIVVEHSNDSANMKLAKLNEIHHKGNQILHGKYLVEMLIGLFLIYLFLFLLFQFIKKR
jgi:hypothetical protein